MSNATVRKTGEVARDTAVETAWAQWAALTAAALPAGNRRAWSIIDPEALMLVSLAVRHEERRLFDLLAGWTREAAFLLSVQRMSTLAAAYPEGVRERLGEFYSLAAESGDRRWRRHGSLSAGAPLAPRKKDLGPLRLIEGPALICRLRAGFGVGSKADLLGFLLGVHGAAAGLRVLSLATGYTERAIRTATEDMELAGFIHRIDGHRPEYRADHQAWAKVLEIYQLRPPPEPGPAIPPWRFWSPVFAFLCHVIEWAEETVQHKQSAYLASSRARDLVEAHGAGLRRAHVPVPESSGVRGVEYLEVFYELVVRTRAWASESI